MKAFALLIAFFATAFSSFADYTLEDISPHFSTNMPIIWQAPTNQLPKSLWIYKKVPRVFSAATISNAVILASFQDKGFPKPSKSRTFIWADHMDGEPQPPYFEVLPAAGQISYSLEDRAPGSAAEYFKDEAAVERAWNALAHLGIQRTEFVRTNVATDGEWGGFLPRQSDGGQI